MDEELFVGTILRCLTDYVSARTEEGHKIDREEAQLFADNAALLVRTMMETNVEFKDPEEPTS